MDQQQAQSQGPAVGDAPLWVGETVAPVAPIPVWSFNAESGELIGQDIAQPDPREPGRFLIPAGAVVEAPPVVAEGEEAARVGGVWVKRKKLPKGKAQDGDKRTPEQVRREQINDRLDVIDRQSVRALRDRIQAIAKGKPVPAVAVTKLDALEAEAVALRAELQGLKA